MDTLQSDPYSRSSLQPYRDASVSFENNNTVLDKHEVVSPRVGMTFEYDWAFGLPEFFGSGNSGNTKFG